MLLDTDDQMGQNVELLAQLREDGRIRDAAQDLLANDAGQRRTPALRKAAPGIDEAPLVLPERAAAPPQGERPCGRNRRSIRPCPPTPTTRRGGERARIRAALR